MDYGPEMMDAVKGSPDGARHFSNSHYANPSHSAYGNPSAMQNPPPSLPAYDPYPQPPYLPPNSISLPAQTLSHPSSPLPQRSSGIAVVIPSPSQSFAQRAPSMHDISRQPIETTQRVPTAPTAALKSGTPAGVVSQLPRIDYQMLLLSLAEDYLTAAHTEGSYRTMRERDIDMRRYYKLVATGLGCLETLLNRFKLQPQMEANIRLRYASVLLDETENMMEAEQSLSDGIKLCDRYRFFDLKYNMDHLLAQVLFKGSPRASMKFLDGVIKDVEAYQHTAWVYAFRFLKVSLSLKLSSHQDILSAFAQLRSISALADQLGDKAILGIASALEALVHLRESSSAESIEQAQRALALARSLQLDPAIGQMSQMVVLINIVDLACSLQHFDPSQAVAKMQAMQASLESHNDTWQRDRAFLIPVKSQGASRAPNGNGIVRMGSKGSLSVVFSWTPWADIYALGYLFSSMAIAHRSTSDGLRSEQMLKEGMRCLDSELDVFFNV
ncbi:MAG: hypothetical protein Q9188_004489 [Gyalolechia gomerana]